MLPSVGTQSFDKDPAIVFRCIQDMLRRRPGKRIIDNSSPLTDAISAYQRVDQAVAMALPIVVDQCN